MKKHSWQHFWIGAACGIAFFISIIVQLNVDFVNLDANTGGDPCLKKENEYYIKLSNIITFLMGMFASVMGFSEIKKYVWYQTNRSSGFKGFFGILNNYCKHIDQLFCQEQAPFYFVKCFWALKSWELTIWCTSQVTAECIYLSKRDILNARKPIWWPNLAMI